jgi:hypothetical protein
MRKTVIDRDILPVFHNRRLAEIGPEDLRALCAKIKGRGAPATAVIAPESVEPRRGQRRIVGQRPVGWLRRIQGELGSLLAAEPALPAMGATRVAFVRPARSSPSGEHAHRV